MLKRNLTSGVITQRLGTIASLIRFLKKRAFGSATYVNRDKARKEADKQRRKTAKWAHYFNDWSVQEKMLADVPRVNAYASAINRHIKPDSVVLDLGAGTGILSFLASQAGARKVFAIESADIIDTAKRLSQANGFARIEFVHEHSQHVELRERVDVIVHEQMHHWIDAEGMIANVVDLRDRLLQPDGVILPSRFEVFLEPIQLKREFRCPLMWEQNIHHVDFSSLRDEQVATSGEYRFKLIDGYQVQRILSKSECLFSFDLKTVNPDELPKKFFHRRRIVRDGQLDGLCFFWRAEFDGVTDLDTCPTAKGRAFHWRNLFYRMESERVCAGQYIEHELEMTDLTSFKDWKVVRIT
jgi:protein arginine N-methyltransferase 1